MVTPYHKKYKKSIVSEINKINNKRGNIMGNNYQNVLTYKYRSDIMFLQQKADARQSTDFHM